MSNFAAQIYAESEMKRFPDHWDEQTKNHVMVMIKEAFNAGQAAGYQLGEGTGKGVAITLLYDTINKLQESK
jgi:predicted acylesterase/phospholipase RssA